MKETKVNKGTPPPQVVVDPSYSEATTVPYTYTPDFRAEVGPPTARVLDVSFAHPPPEAVVLDLSGVDCPSPKFEVKVETHDDEDSNHPADAWYNEMKRRGYCKSPPDTPSGASPPKKKPDTCPSDEKRPPMDKRPDVEKIREHLEDMEKENSVKAFAAAAPYFYNNSERNTKQQSGKTVIFRKDQTTAADAFKGYEERKTPKPFVQSVIAPNSRNQISFKKPSPPPVRSNDDVVVVEEKSDQPAYKRSCWKLKDSAYKDEHAFKKAIVMKKADVMANHIANSTRKIVRATDKEADEVFSDILLDIKLHLYNPATARSMVEDWMNANPN